MGAEVFSGAPDRAPLPGDLEFLQGLALLLRLLGLRLLTPLLPQVRAQRQAFRLFFFFFFVFWRGACQDSSINFCAPFPVS